MKPKVRSLDELIPLLEDLLADLNDAEEEPSPSARTTRPEPQARSKTGQASNVVQFPTDPLHLIQLHCEQRRALFRDLLNDGDDDDPEGA